MILPCNDCLYIHIQHVLHTLVNMYSPNSWFPYSAALIPSEFNTGTMCSPSVNTLTSSKIINN